MSYENACSDLYNKRIAKKQKLEDARNRFRASILDRQNNQSHVRIRTNEAPKMDNSDFIMPDILPFDETKLKWLVAKNIELKMSNPERIKEVNENIKRIKKFVNEQKATH